ncbi:hypothetical protein BGZ61DRAFT_470350 [Ilyonectria robusta]|uniref:uncharacterized protein n=1 Tax=Ilyonectria robusta TaxID=1079257 RepID=UPI001E8DD432|nr:uncharacterized protein BGZ61DRAFT_470350 [Ilyonectria robusta]KAH8736838.1 hypothetical protein BGZ61DRAFT_470350 [Ilyonectria robusta]
MDPLSDSHHLRPRTIKPPSPFVPSFKPKPSTLAALRDAVTPLLLTLLACMPLAAPSSHQMSRSPSLTVYSASVLLAGARLVTVPAHKSPHKSVRLYCQPQRARFPFDSASIRYNTLPDSSAA